MTRQSKTYTVTAEKTALYLGSGTLEVLGTPAVLAMAEEVACSLAASQEDVPVTVGTSAQIDHLAPSAIGDDVVMDVALEARDGRRFSFSFRLLDAQDMEKVLAKGLHERYAVDPDRFMAKLERS